MAASKISIESVVERNSDLLSNEVDLEMVMMNLKNNEYYGLNEIGSRIWQLIDHPIAVKSIVMALIHEYEVETERCATDVIVYLEKLKDKKLININ